MKILSLSVITAFLALTSTASGSGDEPVLEPGGGPPAIAAPPPSVVLTPVDDSMKWSSRYRRFDTAEYALTAVIALSAAGLHLYGNPATMHPTSGPILFDKAVREGIRAKGRDDLVRIRTIGDVFTIAPLVNAFVIDSLLVPIVRNNADAAWQMTWMNVQAYGSSGLVSWVLFAVVGRQRPSFKECHAKTTDDPLCFAGETASFPSGHTAAAFTGAGLTCAHHASLPLFGGGGLDGLACAASLTIATTAGVFRVIGDRHYATDVIVGAGLGFAAGFGMPMLFHYRTPSNAAPSPFGPKMGFAPGATGAPLGASAFGIF